jgi:hypothetical protein
MGRSLVAAGLLLIAIGVLITLGERLPLRLGKLPGDIEIRGKNSAFYFPVTTCLVVSAVLTFVLWLLGKR